MMKEDFINEVNEHGPYNFSNNLYQYNVISLHDLHVMELLNKYLPYEKSSLVLVDIFEDNINDASIYKSFKRFLEYHAQHLYQKMKILG